MTTEVRNLFQGIPGALPTEHFSDLFERPGLRIERIVSRGHATPEGEWYDQDQGEWVLVLQGSARLLFEGESQERDLGVGDYVFIAAHIRHRVTWTDPDQDTIWLAIFIDS